VFKILSWLKFNFELPEPFFGVFFFRGAYGVPFDLVFTFRMTFLWWWLTDSLSIFDFFNRHHFFFSHKFCATEFWVGFWWRWFCGIYWSSSLSPLQPPSLPCLFFPQSTVWYRISSLLGRNTWSITSPWFQFPSFQQQSSFRFGSKHLLLSPGVSWLLGVGFGGLSPGLSGDVPGRRTSEKKVSVCGPGRPRTWSKSLSSQSYWVFYIIHSFMNRLVNDAA